MKNGSLNADFKYVCSLVEPASVFGRELLKRAPVFRDRDELTGELDNIQKVRDGFDANRRLVQRVRDGISPLKDVRRSLAELDSRSFSGLEMFELKCFLLSWESARRDCEKLIKALNLVGFELFDPQRALEIIDPTKQRISSFFIGDELCAGIDGLRAEKRRLEKKLKNADDDELTKQRAALVLSEQKLERETLRRMSRELAPFAEGLVELVSVVARLDLLLEKGRLARERGCGRPAVCECGMRLKDAVNPRLADRIEAFTPISVSLSRGATVVTGANMGGKSVALGVAALSAELLRRGFFPFAAECELELFDEVTVMFGDMSDDERGLSSFGGEIAALKKLTEDIKDKNCFVAIDELARGTNAREGEAVAAAVTGYLNAQSCVALIATHYDNVSPRASAHYQVAGLESGDGLPDEQRGLAERMRYGIFPVAPGARCPHDAVAICRAFGLDGGIIDDIEKILERGD